VGDTVVASVERQKQSAPPHMVWVPGDTFRQRWKIPHNIAGSGSHRASRGRRRVTARHAAECYHAIFERQVQCERSNALRRIELSKT
jgi:hypothetical protein